MTPNDCALLIAIPLTKAEFSKAWHRQSDYVRQHGWSTEGEGWSTYESAIGPVAEAVFQCANELGVKVLTNATLDSLKEALRYPVITLLAHQRFPPIEVAEVIDSEALVRVTQTSTSAHLQILRQRLEGCLTSDQIIEEANQLIGESEKRIAVEPVSDFDEIGRFRRLFRRTASLVRFDRPVLEELWGREILRPGGGVELAEGMVTAGNFVSAIPSDCAALLDLRLCGSITLGAAIRRVRDSVRIAVSTRPISPLAGLVRYKAALTYMDQGERMGLRLSYESAMRAVMRIK
jgi:hypothetical protein